MSYQGQSFMGKILRDDINYGPPGTMATIYRDSDGWSIGGARVHGRARVIPSTPRSETKQPWWTILLAIILFPIGLLFLLVKDKRQVPMSVIEVTGDDNRVFALEMSDVEPAHLQVAIGA